MAGIIGKKRSKKDVYSKVADVLEVTRYISTRDVADNQKASGTIQSFIKANKI